jgi:hypothetical protein
MGFTSPSLYCTRSSDQKPPAGNEQVFDDISLRYTLSGLPKQKVHAREAAAMHLSGSSLSRNIAFFRLALS